MCPRNLDFPCSRSECLSSAGQSFNANISFRLCWYVADRYLRDIKAKEEFSSRVYEGIEALAGFLVSQVRTIERGTDQAKKEAKEQIPTERVKDAAALARELRWRVRLAAGYESDDDGDMRAGVEAIDSHYAGNKRKRSQLDMVNDRVIIFKNFKPKIWETVSEVAVEHNKRIVKARKPEGDLRRGQWVDWKDDLMEADDGDNADVIRRRDVVMKVRRTVAGLERQKVERVIEEWAWTEASTTLSPGGSVDEEVNMEVDSPDKNETNVGIPLEGMVVVA